MRVEPSQMKLVLFYSVCVCVCVCILRSPRELPHPSYYVIPQ